VIGFVIVVGTVGYLLFETSSSGNTEPVLSAIVLRIREHAGAYAVDVEVKNSGRVAAADVHLAGLPRTGSGDGWHPKARVDYVPGRSARRATLIFHSHPGDAPDVRVVGYNEP
jgi:uncharacterized protein (TIGR02588 family)